MLHRVRPQTAQLLDRAANLLAAEELPLDVGHAPRAVVCEERGEPVVVAHHSGIGELAAQRLDLKSVGNAAEIVHRPRSSCPSWRRRPRTITLLEPRTMPSGLQVMPKARWSTSATASTSSSPSTSRSVASTSTGTLPPEATSTPLLFSRSPSNVALSARYRT